MNSLVLRGRRNGGSTPEEREKEEMATLTSVRSERADEASAMKVSKRERERDFRSSERERERDFRSSEREREGERF